jgi:hypothetical protein
MNLLNARGLHTDDRNESVAWRESASALVKHRIQRNLEACATILTGSLTATCAFTMVRALGAKRVSRLTLPMDHIELDRFATGYCPDRWRLRWSGGFCRN